MKISNKEIEEVIKKTAGSGVFSLVKILKNKKRVSEIKLAEYCKKELNEVRSLLYKLHNFNFAFFIKRQDKNTGFYIYYWSLDIKKINDFFINSRKNELRKLERDLANENNKKFYVCADKCVRLDFENASEYSFKCPECNNLLDLEDNNDRIGRIMEKIKDIQTAI